MSITLVGLVVLIVIVAVVLGVYPQIDPTLRRILIAIVVIAALICLLQVFGLLGSVNLNRR